VILETSDVMPVLKGKIIRSAPGYWGPDEIVRPHLIFTGLPSRQIMDLHSYRDVIARYSVTKFPYNVDNIVPSFAVERPGGQEYWSGSNVLIYHISNGLNNIDRNRAADRILLNLIFFSTQAELHR
jgi:hypothetical protein